MSIAIDLTGKVALVTGGSRGLGRADALTLARAGADVVIADLLVESELSEETDEYGPLATVARTQGLVGTESAAEEIRAMGRRALAVKCDVTDRDQVAAAVARAVDELGIADAVRFVTGLPDPSLAELFGSAQVAVVPSLYEGFSIPAVEAMACATPLVASRGGALPEVVGDCGVLVEPGNPSDLAAALRHLLDDDADRDRLGNAGRVRVEQRFTWRATAAATADVYAEAVRAATC